MASSNADLKTRMAQLRHEILSYKPGNAVPCDDERVAFPGKLVIGIIYPYNRGVPSIVHALRRALHGDLEASKLADKRLPSTENQEEYLTDSISLIIARHPDIGIYEPDVQDLAGKVGCMVLLVDPGYNLNNLQWIKVIQEVTGRVPLCVILSIERSEALQKAKTDLNHQGITDIYELPPPWHILSDRNRLQWLDLIHGCLQEGDRVLAINGLKEIKLTRSEVERLQTGREDEKARAEKEKRSLSAEMTKKLESKQHHVDSLTELLEEMKRNETTLRQQVEELKKGREEDRARGEQEKRSLAAKMTKEIESKKQRVDSLTEMLEEKERNETTLRQQVEESEKEREGYIARFEKEKRSVKQLERESWKLRTKIRLESEMRSAEQKKNAETPQWMQSLIPWMTSGKQAHGASSSEDNSTGGMEKSDTSQAGEEPPDDEFADILKHIADDLYDEDKIDSLGGQLGFLQGDIQRAYMTNMRFNRVTSNGTRHMLNQWRRGVSREDERIELRKALEAAKLVNLAEQYLREDTQIDAEYVNEHADDQQLSTRDETSQEQDQTEGHTDTKVLRGATSSNDHTPRDGHTGDMASETREDLTDGSRSQHPDKSLKHSTEKFDASAVTSEDVSSGKVNAGDDMTDVSSIQPSKKSSSRDMQVLPEDMSGIAPLVSSGDKPNEESTILDKSHVGGIISYGEDLISQLVLIDTFPEKILLLFLLKIAMDVSQEALRS